MVLRFVQRTANFANLSLPRLFWASGISSLQNRTEAKSERIIGKLSSSRGREMELREGEEEERSGTLLKDRIMIITRKRRGK
jgi:hypothetical protein